ncbi:MAG: hypothetical protein WCW53_14645, partial [Syntrophales bacterium]
MYPRWRRLDKSSGRSLDHIPQQNEARLLCLRARPGISEMTLRQVPDRWFFVPLGLFIKIPHQRRTMMLANNIGYLPAKFAGCREFASIL